jgi:hypothetical protein
MEKNAGEPKHEKVDLVDSEHEVRHKYWQQNGAEE